MSDETRGLAVESGTDAATMTAEEFKAWMQRNGLENYAQAGAALGYGGEAVRSWVGKGRSGVPKVVALLCGALERIRELGGDGAAQVQQVQPVAGGLDPAALSKAFMVSLRKYAPLSHMSMNPEAVRLALVDAMAAGR